MCNEKFLDARDQFEFYAFYQFLLHDKMWTLFHLEVSCLAVKNISGASFRLTMEQNATQRKDRDV